MKGERLFRFICALIILLTVILCLMPFLLLIMVSISDETSVAAQGYSFWPKSFSLQAYTYLFRKTNTIFRAYGITLFVTLIGTVVNVFMTMMFAYPLSRKDYPWRKVQMIFMMIPMMFSGGLVPTYLMYTQVFHIRDTIWALIVPNLLFNCFNVILLRTYYSGNIHGSLLESAQLDGAGEVKIFFRIVCPLSVPIVATVSLFSGLAYWNDWTNGLYYIMNSRFYSLQVYLNRILSDIQFLNTDTSQASQMLHQTMKSVTLPTTTVRMAIAMVSIIPLMIIFLSLQKYFTKGIAIGAVKG